MSGAARNSRTAARKACRSVTRGSSTLTSVIGCQLSVVGGALVDRQDGAGDVSGRVAGQEHDRVGDLLRLDPRKPHRHAVTEAVLDVGDGRPGPVGAEQPELL